MKKHFLALLFSIIILFSACSRSKNVTTNVTQLKSNDAPQNAVAAQEIQAKEDQVISTTPISDKSWESQPKMSWAGTTVVEMHDGFGNKVEQRSFPNHSLLTMVVIRTPARSEQSIEVYGQNGELRKLPVDKINLALQGTGDEIAAAAGITNTKELIAPQSSNLDQTTAQTTIQNSAESAPQSSNNNVIKEESQSDLKLTEPRTATGAQLNQSDKVGNAN
jgi:hypothetical protein